MEREGDTYRTVAKPSDAVVFKDRKSKFIGYAFPLHDENRVLDIISDLRQRHPTATHACYAWQKGMQPGVFRVNDDGEPMNSAGMPILGQIQAFELTDILVVVLRIYGGTKLGVGGLIQAYRTAAALALDNAHIVIRTLEQQLQLTFPYSEMDKVLRVIRRQKLHIVNRELVLDCTLIISVRKGILDRVIGIFRGMKDITLREL